MKDKKANKKILVAPLNWGLGHAARCIPVVDTLLEEGFDPVLAGDGESLKLLQKEFPGLKSYLLPSYDIRYTKNGRYLKYKLFFDFPRIQKVIRKEKMEVEKIIQKEGIIGIISDNRFGVISNKIPSVYITHQVNILSGITTLFTSRIHQKIIARFDECWVPDYRGDKNLAGQLSQTKRKDLNLKYIGPLSRFKTGALPGIKKRYDLLVLLSGPEPQRSLLEEKILKELSGYSQKVLFVRGVISDRKDVRSLFASSNKNIITVNYLLKNELQKAIIESKLIVSRSGYSTLMDLSKLRARAIFIPTPGQTEQEYLAKYLANKKIAGFALQKNFKLADLKSAGYFTGFLETGSEQKISKLFAIFNR